MARTARSEPSLEQVVSEIRKIRLQRFFSLSESEMNELASKHESMIPFLYEIYHRYGEDMDERMRSAVVVYMLSKGTDFETVYSELNSAKDRREALSKIAGKNRENRAYN